MRTADFDFDLPEDRIALRPVEPRDSARLLVVEGQTRADAVIRDLPGWLRAGDALLINDTRVIPARLSGVRERDGFTVRVEATLHHRDAPDVWSAFMKPGKRLKTGDRVRFGRESENACMLGALDATVEAKGEDGLVTLRFDLAGPALDDAIRDVGVMPLPPYIAAKRAEDDRDRSDYQTVFAQHDGSVAAPTAGLHFTPRLLESATTPDGVIQPFHGDTAIFITPGYAFRAADVLMTNFHLPKSTLFMLVSAFAGLETMRAAYAHAVSDGYRFYSYGDGSLLHRQSLT